ncbi:MAG: sigma-54 dependent transcriptional regulator [Desulfobaccales bacterium]
MFDFSGVLGTSPRIREIFQLLEMVAPSEATVLLLGETGTGKELVAQAIHRNSVRAAGPFVAVNCAALPEALLESELFGHERGSFTGATNRRDGRFVMAHQGTLFLDEVGELTLPIQAKILRVLQAREFDPLGSTRTVKVDVRIIAATNRDLEKMVREGRFREDLFYRLNVFPVVLPPLRERQEDLPALAEFFLKKFGEKNRREGIALAPEVLEAFRRYPWPGNIRELENVMERAVIVCQGNTISVENLPPAFKQRSGFSDAGEEKELEDLEYERKLISRTLERVAGQRRQAAEILGISMDELNFKIRSYGLEGRE